MKQLASSAPTLVSRIWAPTCLQSEKMAGYEDGPSFFQSFGASHARSVFTFGLPTLYAKILKEPKSWSNRPLWGQTLPNWPAATICKITFFKPLVDSPKNKLRLRGGALGANKWHLCQEDAEFEHMLEATHLHGWRVWGTAKCIKVTFFHKVIGVKLQGSLLDL